ncbi:MAG TPA: hypothetical protein VKB26_03615 [Candidatus Acidoferrales bacterium]|nr:hypothetical protein [Candidatus Acidoferrales bacterium]
MRKARSALSAIALALAAALVSAHPVFAQGCALCYNDAAGTGPQAQAALRHGILILAIPPMLIFAMIFAVLYRRRNSYHEALSPARDEKPTHSVSEIVLNLN